MLLHVIVHKVEAGRLDATMRAFLCTACSVHTTRLLSTRIPAQQRACELYVHGVSAVTVKFYAL